MKYTLHNEQVKQNCIKAIHAVDVSVSPVMEVSIKKFVKQRTTAQNSLQWVGMLADFSLQGVMRGRKYDCDIWHEFLKMSFLPEQEEEGITLEGYVKWRELPDGTLQCIGSTKGLTTIGIGQYWDRCYEFGARELEIRFTASPKQGY